MGVRGLTEARKKFKHFLEREREQYRDGQPWDRGGKGKGQGSLKFFPRCIVPTELIIRATLVTPDRVSTTKKQATEKFSKNRKILYFEKFRIFKKFFRILKNNYIFGNQIEKSGGYPLTPLGAVAGGPRPPNFVPPHSPQRDYTRGHKFFVEGAVEGNQNGQGKYLKVQENP